MRHIALHSSANGGGRVDTAAWQGQGRQGLGEEGLWQAAEDASRRKDLSRMRQAGTLREWNQACDSRLVRLISYIHHTSNSIVTFQTGIPRRRFCRKFGRQTQKSTSGGVLYIYALYIYILYIYLIRTRLCRFHWLVKSKQLYPSAALRSCSYLA